MILSEFTKEGGIMPYEVDFIGVKNSSKDADAIGIRWWEEDLGRYIIGVIDGGFTSHGQELEEIIEKYYFAETDYKHIDFIICTHADQDHVIGIKHILSKFEVDKLYINLPWKYTKELEEFKEDGRKTIKTINESLQNKYKDIFEIEQIALERKVKLCPLFQGTRIANRLLVLSPSKQFYFDRLIESSKTPYSSKETIREGLIKSACQYIYNIIETWTKDSLKEDEKTSPENEMSSVILSKMDEEWILFTGDAGVQGLTTAMDYADKVEPEWKNKVRIYQIPHHGSRHNVTPSILNRMIGEIVISNTGKKAYVCSGDNTTKPHPLKVVTNAYIRRGVQVYSATGCTIQHSNGTSSRDGWSKTSALEFSQKGESE